jgi:hypothetical protein
MKRLKAVANEHDKVALLPAASSLDVSRYPFRTPDWLWTDLRRSCCVDADHRRVLQARFAMVDAASGKFGPVADDVEQAATAELNRLLSVRDLAAEGRSFTSTRGVELVAQLDPTFEAAQKDTLRAAIPLFLEHATDADVLEEAMRQSVDAPAPLPSKYQETSPGTPLLDDLGRPVFTDAYELFLRSYHRPSRASEVKRQIEASLRPGQDNLVVLSRYSGNVWWGRSWYHFFHLQEQQLQYFAPARGFVYIGINSDKMDAGVAGASDAEFWASKIGHEWLHNLGYWHPGYADPAERDANNKPGSMAFIVAYEQALLSKLRALKANREPRG